jgi:hypothetical protein
LIFKEQAIAIANRFVKRIPLVNWRMEEALIPRPTKGKDNFTIIYTIVPGMSEKQLVLEVDREGNLFYDDLDPELFYAMEKEVELSFEF